MSVADVTTKQPSFAGEIGLLVARDGGDGGAPPEDADDDAGTDTSVVSSLGASLLQRRQC